MGRVFGLTFQVGFGLTSLKFDRCLGLVLRRVDLQDLVVERRGWLVGERHGGDVDGFPEGPRGRG
jgi:hypothetical protein